MKAAIIAGCVVLSVLSAPGAHAEDCLAPDYFDPPECKQLTHEEFRACINRMWAARPEPQWVPGHWSQEKWDCALHWTPRWDKQKQAYDEEDRAIIDIDDLPKLRQIFEGYTMKGHCAFLQCLEDRGKGKVKHCYANDKRWRYCPERPDHKCNNLDEFGMC